MTPDFDKIQTGHVNSVRKTEKKQEKQNVEKQEKAFLPSYDEVSSDTGVIGRSTVKADNFETDMKKLKENPEVVNFRIQLIDILLKKGYSLEEAVYATHTEFDS